jgi:nucleotide-binding universal stress UspA family protein
VYKNILLPTDGTEFCEKAVRHGVALAKLAGARVTGMTVTIPFSRFVPPSVPPDMVEKLRVSRRAAVKRTLASVESTAKASGLPCETVEVEDEHPH